MYEFLENEDLLNFITSDPGSCNEKDIESRRKKYRIDALLEAYKSTAFDFKKKEVQFDLHTRLHGINYVTKEGSSRISTSSSFTFPEQDFLREATGEIIGCFCGKHYMECGHFEHQNSTIYESIELLPSQPDISVIIKSTPVLSVSDKSFEQLLVRLKEKTMWKWIGSLTYPQFEFPFPWEIGGDDWEFPQLMTIIPGNFYGKSCCVVETK